MEVSLSSAMADAISLSHQLTTPDSLQISSLIFPIDAVAPPPVRSPSSFRTSARRTLLKRRRLTRRRSPSSDDDSGFSGGDDGTFFGGFGGGGRGWNSDGFGGGGGFNWNDWSSSSSYPDDPAFDFVYEVHGLLHLLGFDHELSEEAEAEMEKEEELLLNNLGWEGKGLIKSACDAEYDGSLHVKDPDDRKKEGSLRFYRPKFKYIFCDMDGTLLNSKSQISSANANALREAMSRGVQVVIATGKARPGAIDTLKTVGLFGRDGVVSESSPGVFLQGLLVYGIQGREIFRRNLDPNFCREVFSYSLEHQIPLVAFCGDRCLTLFDHPLVDSLHSVYREPKAETMPSADQLLATAEVQKLVFLDTAERVRTTIRPYWSDAAGSHASVVQAIPDMLEIVPHGTSKGIGVKWLLDHLGVSTDEIMAIGDGENDIEMLKLANLGVALSNGAEKTKAVADVIGLSNDEHGVADAIYRYAF